jgi:4-hydroxybenzoate polyprenyltransferase
MKVGLDFLLKFYRVPDWIKVLGLVLIPCLFFKALITDTLKLIFITSLLLAYAFSINDFFDFKCRGEKNLVGEIYKERKNISVLLLLIPSFMLICFSAVTFPTFLFRIFFILDFLIFSFYSIPPFRLRDRKIIDVLSNSLMFPLILLYSYFYFTVSLSLFILLLFLSLFFYFLVSEIIHEIAHSKKDRLTGRITTAAWLGRKHSIKLIKLILFLSLPIFIFFIISLPHFFNIFPIVSSLFSLLRIDRINSWKGGFSKLRNKIYGTEEGVIYVGLLLIFKLFLQQE